VWPRRVAWAVMVMGVGGEADLLGVVAVAGTVLEGGSRCSEQATAR
jgi:hypothetical protein